MKKILTIFCLVFLISNSASAANFFIGVDALHSNARHKVKNSSGTGADEGSTAKGKEYNYGFNTGVRQDILLWFGTAELFYDNLNINSKGFNSSGNTNNRIKLNERYGVKFNAGMAMLPKISPFITLGAANVRYDSNGSSLDNASKFTPLYGVGVMFDLPLDISLKVSYDYQQFNANLSDGAKSKTHLGVAKVGLIYNF